LGVFLYVCKPKLVETVVVLLQGHLIAINVGGRNSKLTKPNETDVLFFKIETGQVSRRIELAEIIDDQSSSKCRFLACDGKRLFVVDLGK
jgi:hypothetical protein